MGPLPKLSQNSPPSSLSLPKKKKCGVPKKGHICPYQPKLKRRPDEPPPETRSASTQVEMDEFLVLRRLNLEIQGFPESYASAPDGSGPGGGEGGGSICEDMVGAEAAPPRPHSAGGGGGGGIPSARRSGNPGPSGRGGRSPPGSGDGERRDEARSGHVHGVHGGGRGTRGGRP